MADEASPLRAPKIEGRDEPAPAAGPSPPKPKPWTVPPHGLAVFHGSGETARLSHYFLPRLLLEGKRILFLDGANSADPRLLARLARERGVDFEQFSRQIQIARAFTCFQLTELIARVPRFLEKFSAQVLMVTALPDLYFDGDVRDWDARVAFERALADLRRYGSGDPAVAGPPLQIAIFSSSSDFVPVPSRKRFFDQTCGAAAEVWKFSADEQGRTKLLCMRSLSGVRGQLPVGGSSQSKVDS